jgi:hypothetical protein
MRVTKEEYYQTTRRHKPPTPAQQQKLVDEWNAKHAVGARVKLLKDDDSIVETVTRSRAELLSGHTAVIWLEGVSGCYCLERVTAL